MTPDTQEKTMNDPKPIENAGDVVTMPELPAGSAITPAAPITPMQMLQIAVEQGADLDKLTKLMDLQDRWEIKQARNAFVRAMADFKSDPPKIIKDRHVSFGEGRARTEYDHATIGPVCDAVGKGLSEHGISHDWDIEQGDDDKVKVTCILTHVLGHEKRVSMRGSPDASGSKNAIQQIGSTTTYLQRYTLLMATGLAPVDKDTDGAGPVDLISAEQKETLIGLMKEVEADVPKFLKYLGIDNIDQLPASEFHQATTALEAKRSAKK